MQEHEMYMRRCIELAKLGIGYVSPNPMVGAVLVQNGKIIAEGYHKIFGAKHAEVNCIEAWLRQTESNRLAHVPEHCTLYVSLEPCNHYGKTPPCTALIIEQKIKKVVIGTRDPFGLVNGKGIERLLNEGIEVIEGVLETECRELNKCFFTYHTKHRPYVVLKWAQSKNNFIAEKNKRVKISNALTDRFVHKLRSQSDAILVGTNTVLVDNPMLTNRYWYGKNPKRIVLDKQLALPETLHVFDKSVSTILLNAIKDVEVENKSIPSNKLLYIKLNDKDFTPAAILNKLYEQNIQSVLVEGGQKLLQSFIDAGIWDEAFVITNKNCTIQSGVQSPILTNAQIISSNTFDSDLVENYSCISKN